MARLRRRKKAYVDDTRTVINEAEVNRRRMLALADRLGDLVEDLRELTATKVRQQNEGTESGG
jgi:hypothetical protein